MSTREDIVFEYLRKFNSGKWDEISPIFGNNLNNFLLYLKRKDYLEHVDINEIYYNGDSGLVNQILLTILKSNKSYLNEIVQYYLSDVEIHKDGYYLVIDDLVELSVFFDTTGSFRYEDSRSIAEGALSSDFWEPFSDTSYDFYQDIIENLNENNIYILGDKILKIIGNQELPLDKFYSSYFKSISSNGFFVITESNIKDVIEESNSLNILFNKVEKLKTLRSKLLSLYDKSYNEAYSDLMFKECMNELSLFFEVDFNWEYSNNRNPKALFKIKDLYEDVILFLEYFKTSYATFIDDNSYLKMMSRYLSSDDKLLTLYPDQDPDETEIAEYLNEWLPENL